MPRAAVREKESPAPPVTQTVKTIVTTTATPAEPAPLESSDSAAKPTLDEFMRALPLTEIEDYSFYITRLSPLVSVREGYAYLCRLEPQNFNELSLGEFTSSLKDWLKRKYGGSKYDLKVNLRKTGMCQYHETFTIEGLPLLSTREAWRDGTAPASPQSNPMEGVMMQQFLKLVDEKLQSVKSGASEPNAAIASILSTAEKMNDRFVTMVTSQLPKAEDPVSMLTKMMEAMRLLGFKREGEQPAQAPKTIIEQLQELKQAGELLGLWGGAQKNPLDQFTSLKDLIAAVKELAPSLGLKVAGGAAVAAASAWPGLVERLGPQIVAGLPAILDKVKEIMILRAQALASAPPAPHVQPALPPRRGEVTVINPAGRPVPVAGPREPRTLASRLSPVATGGAAATVPQPAAPPTPPPAAPTAPAPAADPWQELATRIVGWLRAGTPGNDVAFWLSMYNNEQAVLLGNLTRDQLFDNVISKDPILAQMIGHPRLSVFLDEFLGFFRPEPVPEGE